MGGLEGYWVVSYFLSVFIYVRKRDVFRNFQMLNQFQL